MMEAFFFGPPERQLFASYHPPAGGNARILTVICPPLFSEYMRTHLLLRELAVDLAGRGQHVLRFDYRGTGDSSGELADVTVSDWLEDIRLAVQEGRDLSGCTQVQLVGVRAGALLACRAAGAWHDFTRVVLWDPVSDGDDYLRCLRRIQQGILERNPYLSRADRRDALHEHGGYCLPGRMLDEFRLLDASAYSSVPAHKLRLVTTSPADGFPVPGVPRDLAPVACDWETDLEAQIMPRAVLERLTACLNP
jgi:pimeloyl-ACP methyl ester carboxylesterase